MDMSGVEGEEKPAHVNEVPEYAAEIHTYIREMEVRKSLPWILAHRAEKSTLPPETQGPSRNCIYRR